MPDRLTLEEATVECEIRRLRCLDASTNGYNPAAACAWQDAKAILNRVHVPAADEEGQAVLWLIKWYDWNVLFDERNGWYERQKGFYFNPIKESQKLGWGGGE